MMFAREPSKATRVIKKKLILRKKVKKSKKWTLARLKGSPASRGQKKRSSSLQKPEKIFSLDRGEKKKKNNKRRTLKEEKRRIPPHSILPHF